MRIITHIEPLTVTGVCFGESFVAGLLKLVSPQVVLKSPTALCVCVCVWHVSLCVNAAVKCDEKPNDTGGRKHDLSLRIHYPEHITPHLTHNTSLFPLQRETIYFHVRFISVFTSLGAERVKVKKEE